jgi:Gtp-binding protein of the ras superfamily involved in termination of M-phase
MILNENWIAFAVCGSVVIKVGMVGDSQIGKTSLMVKYVEGSFDEDYIQTLGTPPLSAPVRICWRAPGVNFMEKTISVRRTTITFSIWDLGGQREFVNMLPLVCNDAVAILFMFDLSRKSTLNSVKEWYRQARGFNKVSAARQSVCMLCGSLHLRVSNGQRWRAMVFF